MNKSKSFAPIIDENSKVLILGTMPGIKSLEIQQYYANERNAFWPIIFKLLNNDFAIEYQTRTKLLLKNGIALWDTLKFCVREGSLDSDIQHAEPNNINALLKDHPKIKNVVFNGQFAEKFYKKYNHKIQEIQYWTFPSTSPANARLNLAQKTDKWSVIKEMV